MAVNPHKNHRKRLRHELIEQDFPDSMPDHKVLEALLFYGIAQRDTNPLAHELIDTFGSFPAVLEAEADALFQVSNMTERAVFLIKLMLPLFRRYNSQRLTVCRRFKSIEHIASELVKKHAGYGREVFLLTCLNEAGDLIAYDVLAKGTTTGVAFNTKEVVQKALKHGATFVIISHNHLTDIVNPSENDIESTQRLSLVLNEIGIKLVDHVIVAGEKYFSLVQNKLYKSTV